MVDRIVKMARRGAPLVAVLGLVVAGLLTLGTGQAAALEQPDTIDLDTLEMVPKNMWGVSGQNPSQTQTETLDVLVYDFAQSGDYMFVGGAFLNVQKNKTATPIPQAYVAAFDIYTGEWIDTWTPTFDRAVYALDVLPNGSLLVGGEFENVNGTSRRGLVALDPTTGEIDPSFAGAVDRPWSSRRATVRDMKVEPDGWIYVAGNFSHLDGAGGSRTQVSKAGRFSNAAGVIDAAWKPQVAGGAVWGLDTDPSRNEVALSGFFTSVNAEGATGHFHVVNDSTGATEPGKIERLRNYPASQPEVWDVVYGDGLIFAIGEQHIVQVLDADNHNQIGYHHTGYSNNGFSYSGGFAGGSYQAGEKIGNIVFAGCHCTHGTNNHYESFTGRRTTRRTVMAYDAQTGRHLEQFNADVQSPRDGFWAAASSTNGCLYLGGDYHVGGTQAGQERWLGGFAKLCSPQPTNSVVDPGAQAAILGQGVSLQVQAQVQPDLTASYTATGLPPGLTIDSAAGLITGTPTSLGSYTVNVVVGDVGDVAVEARVSFIWSVMDGVAPVLEQVSRTVVLDSDDLAIQLVATDAEGAPFIWTAQGLPQGASVDEDGKIAGRPAAGSYTVVVTVTDAVGLSDTMSFDLVVIENQNVSAIESYSGYGSSGGSYFMGWQFTVDTEMTISELGAHDSNRDGTLSNTGATTAALWDKATRQILAQINIPSDVTIEDGFGYAELDNPVTVVPGKTYIVAAEISGEPYAYNGNIQYGEDVNYIGYAYKGGAAIGWPSIQGAGGNYYYGGTFRVSSDPTPILDEIEDQVSMINAATSLDPQAAAADGIELTWSATGLPSGLTIDADTGRISGTPDTLDDSTVTVTVIDEIGLSATQSFSWTVMDSNAPTVQTVQDVTVVESDEIDIQVVATDAEGSSLEYAATGLPEGVWIASSTGLISGTASADGVYNVTVTATDAIGLSGTRSFTLTVLNWDEIAAIANYTGFATGSGNYFIGWQFTVDNTMTIADLGAFDANGDGTLNNSGVTTVGLYNKATAQLLGRVDVAVGAPVEDGFAYGPLDQPVTVEPGVTYVVAAETSGEPFAYNGSIEYGEGVNYAGYAYKGGASIGYPSSQGSAGPYYFGGTFRVRGDRPDPGGGGGGADPLLAAGASWRYEDSGADLGSAWRQPDFADGAWSTGDAELGFGDGDEATTMTPGAVTYYARTNFQFSGTKPASLEIDLKVDDGAVVYLNGVEILRDNMPDGLIRSSTTARTFKTGADEDFSTFVVAADPLREGNNVLAVEAHNVWAGSSDLSLDMVVTPSEQNGGGVGPGNLIEAGAVWANSDSANGEPANWKQGLAGVPENAAEFGFGDGDEVTTLTPGQETYYFTRSFTVDNPGDYAQLTLGLAADDGAVVYINGVDVQRVRMPDGAIGFDTRPSTWATGADERFAEYTIGADALVQGDNVIAVEVHNFWPGNNDLSFDLYLG
ncbi:MAG: putative Ig domain-containing protein [Acidimicrobiales bacterium]